MDWASGLGILEVRDLGVSPDSMVRIMTELGPNLREFRFDCDIRVQESLVAFEALQYLKKVEVFELGLLFKELYGEDMAHFFSLRHLHHSGKLREFVIRARDLGSSDLRYEGFADEVSLRFEGLASFLNKSPQLQVLAISQLPLSLPSLSSLSQDMTVLKGLKKLRNLSMVLHVDRSSLDPYARQELANCFEQMDRLRRS